MPVFVTLLRYTGVTFIQYAETEKDLRSSRYFKMFCCDKRPLDRNESSKFYFSGVSKGKDQ